MSTVVLPADLIPDCPETFEPPVWVPRWTYPVVTDLAYRLVAIPTRRHVVRIGPYIPGEVYLIPAAEADRLERVKGMMGASFGESPDYCPIGGYGVVSIGLIKTADGCLARTVEACLIRTDTIITG